jgi:Plasmid replication region DNA-binding N-term
MNTEAKIIDAANKLQDEGKKPTMEAVREAIGGGSFATISPVLRKWRESQAQSQAITLEMPNDIKSIFDKSAVELWKGLANITAERITKAEAESTKQINVAQSERDEALTEIERLEGLLSASIAQNQMLTNENKELTLQAQKQRITMEFAESKQTELKIELKELKGEIRLRDVELGELRTKSNQKIKIKT